MSAHQSSSDPVIVNAKNLRLRGKIAVPGDKSITHRAIMFGGIASGTTKLESSILGRDNFASLRIMRQLGAKVSGFVTPSLRQIADEEGFSSLGTGSGSFSQLEIVGCGPGNLQAPDGDLDCGNSGTTARLMTGILAPQNFLATLVGDHSLSSRPFKRVVEPLARMGAGFSGERLPLTVTGAGAGGCELKAIRYESPKASAQVKSAILLAGLRAEGETVVVEPHLSRDHTERMFTAMGVKVRTRTTAEGVEITLPPRSVRGELRGIEIEIPGDFSAAAFFLVAGSIVPDSEIVLTNVGINPARVGLLNILRRMGASIELTNLRTVGGEEVSDIVVKSSNLRGIPIGAEDVVLAIDEIPVLAVACALAEGESVISGAEELRVKESDRLTMTAKILSGFGAAVEELKDGLRIPGDPTLAGRFASNPQNAAGMISGWTGSGDHRIAMAGAVMQFALSGRFDLYDQSAVETSFPGFVQCFQDLTK